MVSVDWYSTVSLMGVAIVLGMRHGLDLDHLAVIDAMTRRLAQDSHLSNWVGCLFSLGHGLVVIAYSIIINLFFKGFKLASWFEHTMVGLSIALLLLFGAVNLFSLLKQKISIKEKLLPQFVPQKAYQIMAVGAVFAVSFDTVTQVTLLSLNISNFFGLLLSITLAVVFMLGMMFSDGLNGWLLASFVAKAQHKRAQWGRWLTAMVGGFSTVIGLYELTQFL